MGFKPLNAKEMHAAPLFEKDRGMHFARMRGGEGAQEVSIAPWVGTHRVHATPGLIQREEGYGTMRFSALALITGIGVTGLAVFTPRIALAQG